MAVGTWTVHADGLQRILKHLDGAGTASTYKVALFTSSSDVTTAASYAAATNEVASGSGYTTGGVAVTLTLTGTTTVTVSVAANPTWTPTGADIVWRWAALYEVGGDIIGYILGDSAPADTTFVDGALCTIDITTNGLWVVTKTP